MFKSNLERETPSGGRKTPRRWLYAASGFLVLMLAVAASLLPYLGSSSELVRLRNALLLLPSTANDFNWSPESYPRGFLVDTEDPIPEFALVAERLRLKSLSTDWDRVRVIGKHLLSARPQRDLPPIQARLRETHQRITENGEGYCGDFVPVFMGLAMAAGMPVRSWAFTLDGFGGHGHIWVEVWNRDLRQWQLIDIFNNVFFHTGNGVAISALEFRRLLPEAPRSMTRSLLYEGALPGYVYEDKMWDYYQRGSSEWFLVWGNNVFSYDRAFTTRLLSRLSLSLEQLAGIATGVYPAIKVLDSQTQPERIEALHRLKTQLTFAAWTGALSFLGFAICLLLFRRAVKTELSKTPLPNWAPK